MITGSFPLSRARRTRTTAALRNMVTEHHLHPSDFIVPLFIIEGKNERSSISSMPGYERMSIDLTVNEVKSLYNMGLRSVLLFVKALDETKDNTGKEALNPDGLMQRSIKAIKDAVPEMVIMTDVALDPYSSYGHDGIVKNGQIVNEETVQVLAQMAVSHAHAGADMVAPSDMMDGRILRIREALDAEQFINTGIMAYSAKYASCFYGPFRDALDSAPGFGDKKTYQMNPANSREAIRETLMDVQEGADIVMVKPGMHYLDIVKQLREHVTVPISVYQVSGEYAMIKAAAERGWLNESQAILESLIAFKRAGADLIATYFAKQAVTLLG